MGSFHHKQIKRFSDISVQWSIPTSANRLEVLAFLGHFTLFSHKKFYVFQVPINYNFLKIVTQKIIERAHKLNLAVHPWVINDEQTMMNLLNGVSIIFFLMILNYYKRYGILTS
ncbi:MAG: hypothetical protein GPJ50_04495 [Candidatus Heimdallarchaeota archaeon]|nr:hypothetical protein [Candidatus Heimdallarchaeota archaeon]